MTDHGPREIECVKCKSRFMAELPNPQIVNQKDFSMMILLHKETYDCPNCQAQHVFTLGGQVSYQANIVVIEPRPAQPPQVGGNNGRIIIPPPGVKIPRK